VVLRHEAGRWQVGGVVDAIRSSDGWIGDSDSDAEAGPPPAGAEAPQSEGPASGLAREEPAANRSAGSADAAPQQPLQAASKTAEPAAAQEKRAETPATPAHEVDPTAEELALRAGPVVYQGWIHSREPTLRALWHRRWAVARQGRLDLYENETMAKIVSTVPLQQCRVEKLVVRDSRLQDGCDFEHGIRVVLGKGLGFGKEKLLATTSEGEQNGWGGALMSCRQGVLEVAVQAAAPQGPEGIAPIAGGTRMGRSSSKVIEWSRSTKGAVVTASRKLSPLTAQGFSLRSVPTRTFGLTLVPACHRVATSWGPLLASVSRSASLSRHCFLLSRRWRPTLSLQSERWECVR